VPSAAPRPPRPARRRRQRGLRLARIRAALGGLAARLARARTLSAAVAAATLIVAGAATATVALRRHATAPIDFPDESQAERDLYSLLVPEEVAAGAGGLPGPSTLRSLAVGAYTVVKGDTISVIAQKAGRSLDTVLSWNDIRDVRSLAPGTVLGIPNADGLRYRVRRGDTLEAIARRAGVPLEKLLDFNDLSTSVIKAGDILFLPGAHMAASDVARILGNLFIYPLRGRLTSQFGNRISPITGVRTFHAGVDLKANIGTSVGAAMAGRVIDVGVNATFGRYVILSHGGAYQTLYAHLDRAYVAKGTQVSQGEKIAESGNTGETTGPHLHFGIYRNGEAVDPLGYLR